jgi:dihydroflavonol-4-reductase
MRVLVTGASGFIGGAVARELQRRGHGVRALVRSRLRAKELARLGAELVVGELEDPTSLALALHETDAVVHAAGLTVEASPGDHSRVDIEGTRNVLEAVVARGGIERVLFVSSVAAMGPAPVGGRLEETMPCLPVSAHGRAKLDGERLVRALSRDAYAYTIVRPPVVYGPGDRKLAPLYKLAQTGVLPGLDDATRRGSLIHIDDLVRGLADALESPAGANEHFLMADPEAPTLDEVLRTIGFAAGNQVTLLRLPRGAVFGMAVLAQGLARLTGRPTAFTPDLLADVFGDSWECSTEHARAVLGFEAKIGWRDGLRSAAAWYLERSLPA